MSDFSWWRAALHNPHSIGSPALPVHEDKPQCGYYKNSQNPPEACAIWMQDGQLVALEGNRKVDAQDLWTWVCRRPISYQLYKRVTEGGEPWPEEPPSPIAPTNLPADEVERLDMELAGEIELAEKFLMEPIANQTAADRAAIWAKRIADIEKRFDQIRDERKRPHLEAGRRIDADFKPRIEKAADWKTRLKRHLDAWLRAQAEAERKRQEEARREADRIRQEFEEAERQAAEATRAIEEAPVDQPLDNEIMSEVDAAMARAEEKQKALEQARADAERRSTAAGRSGAKVALRAYKLPRITDPDAFLLAIKDQKEISEAMDKVAARLARNGVTVAGMEIYVEERAA